MQIDLLATRRGDMGLVSTQHFDTEISVAIFDTDERSLTLEFGAAMDTLKLNVPVGDDFIPLIHGTSYLHFCAIEKGRMVAALQIPLLKISMNDDSADLDEKPIPYGIANVQSWMRQTTKGQPIHRDNLADEGSSGGVMHGLAANTLQAAPQLAQALAQERALANRHTLQAAPRMAGPGLGLGSSTMGGTTPTQSRGWQAPPSESE